jgi:UDP-N-acetylmuramyl pentapeptide synthase
VAILGDMAELGRTAQGYHREVGEAAAAAGVEQLLAVGELARGYVDGAAGVPALWVPNVHEALRALDEVVRPGDAVLVKGSRAMGLEAVAEALAAVTH